VFDLPQILAKLNEIIICKSCIDRNKLMCENSAAFVKFIVENANDEVLQRILKYLFLPNKYKHNETIESILHMEPTEVTFA